MGRAEPWSWALSTPPNWLLRELRPGEGATCPTARPKEGREGRGERVEGRIADSASGAGGRGSLFGGSAPEDELTPACCPACPSRALPTGAGCLASPGPLPAALRDPTLPMGTTAEGAGSAMLSTGRLGPPPAGGSPVAQSERGRAWERAKQSDTRTRRPSAHARLTSPGNSPARLGVGV